MSQRVASVCRGVTLVNFLPTSGCIQDPVSLTSVDPATTAGFTFICTTNGKKKSYPGSYCTYRHKPVLDISWITIRKYKQNKTKSEGTTDISLSDLALSSPTFAENLKTIHSEQKLSSMPGLCGYATKNVSRHIQQQSTHTHLLIGYSTHLTYCKCTSLHLLHIYTGAYPWTCHKCARCCPIPHTGEWKKKKKLKKINITRSVHADSVPEGCGCSKYQIT